MQAALAFENKQTYNPFVRCHIKQNEPERIVFLLILCIIQI